MQVTHRHRVQSFDVPDQCWLVAFCRLVAGISPCRLLLSIEDQRIRNTGIDARLIEQGRNLSAMVGLVIEQVNDRGSERVVKFLSGIILITERSVEPLRRNPGKELFDLLVGPAALAAKFGEIRIQLLVQRSERPWLPVETRHPAAVGQKQVVESAVNRSEEGPAVALTFFVG